MLDALDDKRENLSLPSCTQEKDEDCLQDDTPGMSLFASSSFDMGQYQYASMLENVVALKSEQERKNLHLSRLTEENHQLRRERDSLSHDLSEIRLRYNESKKCLAGQVQTISRREQEMAKVESKWRAFVEREREEIQNGLRDLEAKRQKLETDREDVALCVGNNEDCVRELADLRNEVERERDKYLRLKREHEISKVQHEVALATALQNLEASNGERETITRSLESQMKEVTENNEMKTKMLKTAQMQLRESEQRLRQRMSIEQELRNELDQAQKDRDNLVIAKLEAVSRYEVELKELSADNTLAKSMLHASQNEVKHLRNEKDSSNITKQQLRDKVCELEKSLNLSKKECEEKSQEVVDLKDDFELERGSLNARIDRESLVLKKVKDLSNEQRHKMEDNMKQVETVFEAFRRDAITKQEHARRELRATKNNAMVQTVQLEKNVALLKNDLAMKHTESTLSIRNLQQAIEVCQHESNLLSEENNSLRQEYESIYESSQELKRQLTDMKSRLDSATDSENEKQRQIDSYEGKLTDTERHRNLLLSQLEMKTKELEKAKASLEYQKKNTKTMEQHTRVKEREYKAQIHKEKKKADAYKEKALEAHARTLHAKQLLVNTPRD